jgi:energy-coupling factor transport system permease protein
VLKDISLGRFYPANSPLHRMDPRAKILATVVLMVLVFLANNVYSFVAYGLFSVLCIALSKVPPIHVFKSIKPILFLIVFAFVLNVFSGKGDAIFTIGPVSATWDGLVTGLRMAARLTLLITTSSLLTLTTTPILVADAMERMLKPLQRIGFPAHEMAMMMSIALRFVPTLVEETDKIMKAQSSRGADYDTGGILRRARGLVSVLVPLFIGSFRRADELAVAMEARCYRGGEGRTRLRVMKATSRDWAAGAVLVAFAAIVVCIEFLGSA